MWTAVRSNFSIICKFLQGKHNNKYEVINMIKEREYLLSTTVLNQPEVFEKQQAIAMLLMRLILLNPGSDPLHPEMGVGIVNYRYAMGRLDELKKRVADQINTYLPCFPAGNVEIIINPDNTCDIIITIDNDQYRYSSAEAPIPITIDSAAEYT